MKFTILSHAGLLVEHAGTSVVFDPWLFGSCYWRSWWNFPEPEPSLLQTLTPSYIYITHLHWDHFHGDSLKRFDPATRILVPKVCTTRMVEDLRWLGFSNITEIPHGGHVKLNNDYTLHSYQFGPSVDSLAVLQGGGTTLLNANDCKYFGYPLRALLRRFPNIDFIFRSHSSASAIPYCIEGYKTSFPALRTADDYEEEFARFAVFCRARYAIPFASNHCFLHKETRHFNDTAVTPADAAARCNSLAGKVGASTRSVVMASGSSWDQDGGFNLTQFDYQARDKYVNELEAKYHLKLTKQYIMESSMIADFTSFASYFRALIAAVPWVLRRWYLNKITFRVEGSAGTQYWIVDFRRGLVFESPAVVDAGIVIETPPNVLNDCTTKKMFSVWTASKRLRIFLADVDQRRQLGLFFSILDAFELGVLPLSRNSSFRYLGIYARRWREGAEALRIAFSVGVLRRSFSYREMYPVNRGPLGLSRVRDVCN